MQVPNIVYCCRITDRGSRRRGGEEAREAGKTKGREARVDHSYQARQVKSQGFGPKHFQGFYCSGSSTGPLTCQRALHKRITTLRQQRTVHFSCLHWPSSDKQE
jgi:hypothetical protein